MADSISMHCWARNLLYAVIAVLGVGQIIAACGQKGDLYLPEPPGADERAADAVPELPAESDVPAAPDDVQPTQPIVEPGPGF